MQKFCIRRLPIGRRDEMKKPVNCLKAQFWMPCIWVEVLVILDRSAFMMLHVVNVTAISAIRLVSCRGHWVQGLFGIIPDAMNEKLLLRPGFPQLWNHASINTSDIDFSFKRSGRTDIYSIDQHFQKKLTVELQVRACSDSVSSVRVNGKTVSWKLVENAGEYPVISITTTESGKIEIDYAGHALDKTIAEQTVKYGDIWEFNTHSFINKIFDPQQVVSNIILTKNGLKGKISGTTGHRTLFVQLTQGQMTWWQPINIEISAPAKSIEKAFSEVNITNCEPVNIDRYFNDSLSHIFENKYLSPRSPYTTLQIPTQGIGEWCHPKETAEIDDSGIRRLSKNGLIETKLGVSFRTPATGKNIAFTSQWDNFPKKLEMPLSGSASHAYLLMAGTTNQMQTHFVNGEVVVEYADGRLR